MAYTGSRHESLVRIDMKNTSQPTISNAQHAAERDSTKQERIVSMFDAIAPTYDLTNRVMSFGVDRRWRRIACDRALEFLDKKAIGVVADVACGTGDMLLYWKSRAAKRQISIDNFVGVDPSTEMLMIAQKRVAYADFREGRAQTLPLDDSSCDIISISYGIRNVVERAEAFREFYRVLKPGGIVVIVEFTRRPKSGLVSWAVDLYMKWFIPTIGGLLSRNRKAYTYLPNSIEQFLTKDMLEDELKAANLTVNYSKTYSFGVSSLLIAKKSK